MGEFLWHTLLKNPVMVVAVTSVVVHKAQRAETSAECMIPLSLYCYLLLPSVLWLIHLLSLLIIDCDFFRARAVVLLCLAQWGPDSCLVSFRHYCCVSTDDDDDELQVRMDVYWQSCAMRNNAHLHDPVLVFYPFLSFYPSVFHRTFCKFLLKLSWC